VIEPDDFFSGSTNGSRRDACRPLNRRDSGKHRLFCNLKRRGVDFIASLAAAWDEHSSVVVGAALFHPPDVAEVSQCQTATPSQWATAPGAPSGEAVASVAAPSCLLSLSAAALSKRSSRHDSTTGLGGATVSARDAALLLPPRGRSASRAYWSCPALSDT